MGWAIDIGISLIDPTICGCTGGFFRGWGCGSVQQAVATTTVTGWILLRVFVGAICLALVCGHGSMQQAGATATVTGCMHAAVVTIFVCLADLGAVAMTVGAMGWQRLPSWCVLVWVSVLLCLYSRGTSATVHSGQWLPPLLRAGYWGGCCWCFLASLLRSLTVCGGVLFAAGFFFGFFVSGGCFSGG